MTRPRPSVVNPVGEAEARDNLLFELREMREGEGIAAGGDEWAVVGAECRILLQTTRPRPSVRNGGSGVSRSSEVPGVTSLSLSGRVLG